VLFCSCGWSPPHVRLVVEPSARSFPAGGYCYRGAFAPGRLIAILPLRPAFSFRR
jgi:hypothetical protein